jgi:putative oxidoreductase
VWTWPISITPAHAAQRGPAFIHSTLSGIIMSTVTVNTRADYAAFLLRVTMGIFFLVHAGLKIFVFTPAGTVGFFASLGVPGWFAYPVMALEVVGGIALVLGYYGRWLALPLAADLLGAIVLVHGKADSSSPTPRAAGNTWRCGSSA